MPDDAQGHAYLPDDHIETGTLMRYAKRNTCLVIGAFTGATMRYLLDHGAGYVIGVEPQPWAAERAMANMLARGSGPWEMNKLALVPWETRDNAFGVVDKAGTDAARLLLPNQQPQGNDHIAVSCMSISEFLDSLDEEGHAPDFAVMNVEGWEYMLLPHLLERVPIVLVQYHGPLMPMAMTGMIRRVEVGKGWWLYG